MNGEDNDALIVLNGFSWGRLSSGQWGIIVDCPTHTAFDLLPEWLDVQGKRFVRYQWDPDARVAEFQDWEELVAEVRRLQ